MRWSCTALPLALALAWPLTGSAGVRGDMGWSADGEAYCMCDAWILPDAETGCRFFDRSTRAWMEFGRREAVAAWRPWEEELEPGGTLPLIPVYPMQEDEDNPGPVRLSGRLVPSDDVVELWSLEGDVEHGDRGGEWTTIFDYSPDGLWLAVGAVHVDHETSTNEFFVEVRPVREWLALALSKVALGKLAAGRIRSGIASLAAARRHLDSKERGSGAVPRSPGSPLEDTRYIDDDPLHSRTFARWSVDGRTLCVCESFRELEGDEKTRCRILTPPDGEWRPVLVNLVHTHCPGYGRPPASPAPSTYHLTADGGFDGKRGGVSVYMTGGPLGSALASVVERSWEEELTDRSRYPAWFHPVGLPGPAGKWMAVGFLEERRDAGVHMRYELEVLGTGEWLEMARAEIELHERTEPQTIDDARPALDLPGEGEGGEPETAGPEPERGGCSVTVP